jgi:TonB family protein
MTEHTLTNLVAWIVQGCLVALVAAAASRLLPIDAPAVRYAWWRTVLAVAVLLPLVQPWQPIGLLPTGLLPIDAPALSVSVVPAAATLTPGTPATATRTALQPSTAAAGVLVAGVLLRLGWLALGLMRLRRLRTAGEPAATSGAPDALQQIREAGASVRYVPRLRQPVTFGLRRPVVLLPERLAAMAPPIQRAVLVHELWHVRRRDWPWSVAEELLRAAFWFNPAVWHLVSRVQSAREEVVDELAVLATNARRSYLEALLAFADEPMLYPAAPFARRRHLFNRMLLISREVAMSPTRIVCSGAVMAGALVFTGWYGSLAFPLTAASDPSMIGSIPPPGRIEAPGAVAAMRPRRVAPPRPERTAAQQAQAQPRDPRPDVARPETSREQELQTALRADGSNVTNWLALARLQEERGAIADAERTLQAAVEATQHLEVIQSFAGFYNRQGNFDKTMAMLENLASRDASNPQRHQLMAVYYWEKAQKDQRLSTADKALYIQSGIAATDRALALNPDYVEALTYKNILLRMQGNMETDLARRQALYAEADTLRNRAIELNKTRPAAPRQAAEPGAPPAPPPPPMPPFVDGVRAVRIGGEVKTPMKVRDVKPIYPQEALDAKVSGLVIIEALIDPEGNVRNAQVLRSIPLLNDAALDAVKQWKFAPTVMDGVAVPVVMTVTVNFTPQQRE